MGKRMSAHEISRMRRMIDDLDRDPGKTEDKLITYLGNGTSFEELRELYRDSSRTKFDYSEWNYEGKIRAYQGNECVGYTEYTRADYQQWANEIWHREGGPSLLEWFAKKKIEREKVA